MSIELSNLAKRAGLRIRSKSGLLFGKPFISESEKTLYRKIVAMPEDHGNHPVVTFHPACLNGKGLLCRPGTRDRSSLIDLLFHQAYLPPKPLSNPKVIVDLGANVGYTVAHFAALYPTARIIGLEMDANNFMLAKQNTDWCKDGVTLINAAIWSSDGYVNFAGLGEDAFHVVGTANGSSDADESPTNRRVRSMSMETLMKELDIDRIDYLKMDIEGAEAELILRSNPTWLSRVNAMKVELHDLDYQDFHRTLTARGFRCYPDARQPWCIVAVRD
jgi:FkbM family methyltransferase